MSPIKAAVLSYISAFPGASYAELAKAVGVTNNAAWRHVKDLRAAGKVALAVPRQQRSLRVANSSEALEQAKAAAQNHLVSLAATRCKQIAGRLGQVTSVSEVAEVYQELLELSEQLSSWPGGPREHKE